MMRAVGFKQKYILIFVTLQVLSFAIPGALLGLFISSIMNNGLRLFFFWSYQVYPSYNMNAGTILFGIVGFGLIVPVLANIGPT